MKLLLRYFDAFANLYGILPLRQALAIFNRQNPPIDETVFAEFTIIVRHEKRYYSIFAQEDLYTNIKTTSQPMDYEIIEESLLEDLDVYEEMKAAQADKPYYVPDKQELLRYADDLYIDKNAKFLALRDFLRDKMKLPPDRADDVAEELQLHATMAEKDMNYIIQDIKRMGLKFEDIDSVNIFLSQYYEMANNTRMPINRGHTPNELLSKAGPPKSIHLGPNIMEAVRHGDMNIDDMRMSVSEMKFPNIELKASYLSELDRIDREVNGEGQPGIVLKKVSRNDPCPCGSGKKYKHCCGRNN